MLRTTPFIELNFNNTRLAQWQKILFNYIDNY